MIPDTETVQRLREPFLSGALVHALAQRGVPAPARAEALALADLAESAAAACSAAHRLSRRLRRGRRWRVRRGGEGYQREGTSRAPAIGNGRIRTRVSSSTTTLPCSRASATFGRFASRRAT